MTWFGVVALAVLSAAIDERVRSRLDSDKVRLVVVSRITEKNARISDTEGSVPTRFQRHMCRYQ